MSFIDQILSSYSKDNFVVCRLYYVNENVAEEMGKFRWSRSNGLCLSTLPQSARHAHARKITIVVEKVQTQIIYATMVSWM